MKKVLSLVALVLIFCLALSLPAFAVGSGTITLENQSVTRGQEFTVPIKLTSNPGMISLRLEFTYPSDLTLVSADDTGLLNGKIPQPTSPHILFWNDALASNNTKTGTIATLKFRMASNASCGKKTVKVRVLDAYNASLNPISIADASAVVECTNHSFGAYTVTGAPTCTATGVETRTCSSCGISESRSVAALGHAWGAYTETTKAGCKVTGQETSTCSRCGQTRTRTLPATGHKFGAWVVTKEPTCVETGMRAHTCEKCGTRIPEVVGALGHDFERTTKTIRQPSLSLPGLIEGVCTRCQAKTEIETTCRATDLVTSIVLEVEKGCFAEGARLKVEEIGAKSENYDTLKEIADTLDGAYAMFRLDVLVNGESAPAVGAIKATFPTPEGFSRELKIYFISLDGDPIELESMVNVDGNLVSTMISQFGYYAVVDTTMENASSWEDDDSYDKPADTEPEEDLPAEVESGLTWLWIVLGVIAGAGVICAIVIPIVVKKKKAKKEE